MQRAIWGAVRGGFQVFRRGTFVVWTWPRMGTRRRGTPGSSAME